jgi:ferredoxin-NADP reductase
MGIWVVALLFSFVGILSFNPLAMIVSLAVLVVTTGMSSWLVGALFGVRSHGLSSFITGFILAFLFTPTLSVAGLLALAVVGLVAGASKYIVAFRGRHMFNPAAFGAFFVSIVGLGSASWWVATQYALVGTFLVVSISLLLVYFMANGLAFTDSAVLLLSWPVFFFAGIMLTEPLTLPSKQWHLYAEAVLVAVLFAVPISIGTFETSPIIALLVGNLFAAIVSNRRKVLLKFVKRRRLTPTVDELIFKSAHPVSFQPGQYMELSLPLRRQDLRGERRMFSITSVPNTNEVTFGVKYSIPSSAFKEALRSLKPRDAVSVATISGDFVLPRDTSQKIVLVAGGIGVTPFISQLKTYVAQEQARDIVLIYAVRSMSELAYRDELERLGVAVIVVSPDVPKKFPKQWRHITAARLDEKIIASAVTDIKNRHAYVSGSPTFVQTLRRDLKRAGVRTVRTDSFVGY